MRLRNVLKYSPKFMYKLLRYLYDKIPLKFKQSKRYKKVYKETLAFLEDSQWLTREEHENYQLSELKKMLKHAYETVPYYTKLFNEHKINVNKINSLADFKVIPYLTKEIIQQNKDELISLKYKRSNINYQTTGGSTGIPLGFYVDNDYDKGREDAFITMLYRRVGYENGERTFVLRGNIINGLNLKKNIFHKENYSLNEVNASSYHLNSNNINYYVDALIKSNSVCIKAYPSSLYLIALYIKNNSQACFKNIKLIILASENIYGHQRSLFKEVFPAAKVYSFYGHTEHASLAGECEQNEFYHVQSEYGYTELIKENGLETEAEDEEGEVVATSFTNYVMPFIRYKTSDIAINTNKVCSCGRNYKLIKSIQGRAQEQIITIDSTRVSLTSIIHGQHFEALGKIKEYQLVQNEIGRVLLKIVKSDDFKQSDAKKIKSTMESSVDNRILVDISFVDQIEKTGRGKHKFLIQNIKAS